MRFSVFALATAASLSFVAAFPTRFTDDNLQNLVARFSPHRCEAGPSNILENGTCCQACPDKFTRPAHTDSCTCYPTSTPSCPSGQEWSPSLTICICISLNGGDCSPCNYPNVRDSKNFCHPACPPPTTWNAEHRRCDPTTTPPPPVCGANSSLSQGKCVCKPGFSGYPCVPNCKTPDANGACCASPSVLDSKKFCHAPCPPPSEWNVDSRKCVTCPSGQVSINGNCACPSGSPVDKNGACCFSPKVVVDGQCKEQCVGGQIRNHQNVCECPKPFIFNKGLQKCITCPHGSVATADGNCFQCPAGSEAKPDGTCSCPSGQQFSNGKCVCPADSVKDAAGACCAWPKVVQNGKCVVDCASRGQFRNAKGECECPANSTFNDYDRTCHKNPPPVCPPPAIVSSNGECVCPPGSGQHFSNGSCQCPSGAPLDGQGKCCNDFEVVEGGKCRPFCFGGQVRAPDGSCKCPSPQVFNQMTQKCGTCPPGDITTSNGACIRRSCPAGQEPLANGECPPACLADKHGICCASPNTVYDGSCVPPCGYGQTRGPYGCQCPTGTEWKSSKCEPTAPPAPPAPKGLPKGSRCVLSSECASLICIQAGTLFVSVSTCF